MKRNFIYLFILSFLTIAKVKTNAQNLEWAKGFGSSSSERITSCTADASGNTYVSGFFVGTIDIDPSNAVSILTSSGSTDGFAAKFDASGNLVWAHAIGGSGADRATTIAVNTAGAVAVGGYFGGTITLGGSTFTAGGTRDGFTLEIYSNGTIGDAGVVTGAGQEEVTGITLNNNFFAVTGTFSGTADFDDLIGGLGTKTSAGGLDVFVVGYSIGVYWVNTFGGAGDDFARNIVADNNNNTYTVGAYVGTADFDPTTGIDNRISNGSSDAFLIKQSGAGAVDWVNVFGGVGFDRANDVVLDFGNNPRVVGSFNGAVNMNPNPTTPVNVTSQGGSDIFVSSFASNRLLSWTKTIGGISNDEGTGISRDGNGNMYIGGYFANTVDFNPGVGTENRTSNGSSDAFICKLNGAGDYVWAHAFGSVDNDLGFDVSATSTGFAFLAGTYTNTVDFDPGSAVTNLLSNGADDNFIAKFGTSPVVVAPLPPAATLNIVKRIANVRPATTVGNQIVSYEIDLKNNNTVGYDNLRLTDVFSSNAFGAIVGIVGTPKITFSANPNFFLNPNWNGTTVTQLLDISKNSTIGVGQTIRIAYDVEVNRNLLNNAITYTNTATVTSTTSTITGTATLNMALPITITLPKNMSSDITTGQPKVLYPQWLQTYGNAAVVAHPTCGQVKWTYYQDITPFTQNCGQTGVRHALFSGIDGCGNLYKYYADFTIIDKGAPVFDMLPTNKSIDCSDKNAAASLATWLSSAGNAWLTDPGDEGYLYKINVTNDFINSNLNCASGPKIVKFTVTDACNNAATATALLSIIDNVAPQFTAVPNDLTIKCGTNYSFGTPQVTDDCSSVTLTFVDAKSPTPCINGSEDIRTWTATDACGNTATASQRVIFEDLTVSTIVMTMTNKIADKTATCSQNIDFDMPAMISNCPKGVITTTYEDNIVAGTCAKDYTITRTWTFTDECNNAYQVKQNIVVTDNVPPTFDSKLGTFFTMPKGIFNAWKKTYLSQVKATDVCSVVSHQAPVFSAVSAMMVNCKIVATDECGNIGTYNCVVKLLNSTSNATKTENSANENIESIATLEDFIQHGDEVEVTTAPVIYPNPTSKTVNIIPAKGVGDIQKIHLYNSNGQSVLNLDVEGMQNQVISIDISSFQNAIYLIEMEHTDKKLYKKVIKQ
jgi:Secretion system C-terminal sorting domain